MLLQQLDPGAAVARGSPLLVRMFVPLWLVNATNHPLGRWWWPPSRSLKTRRQKRRQEAYMAACRLQPRAAPSESWRQGPSQLESQSKLLRSTVQPCTAQLHYICDAASGTHITVCWSMCRWAFQLGMCTMAYRAWSVMRSDEATDNA